MRLRRLATRVTPIASLALVVLLAPDAEAHRGENHEASPAFVPVPLSGPAAHVVATPEESAEGEPSACAVLQALPVTGEMALWVRRHCHCRDTAQPITMLPGHEQAVRPPRVAAAVGLRSSRLPRRPPDLPARDDRRTPPVPPPEV